ncbi:hypothetical protein [Cellulomonas alba]|uniref:Uncharacterized protein n=1 Tax=Cellulomonas alba TaxID=3053467 RepID=A0ABT7SHL7_9CELL|nr:hypothetical protein [Cellulomonas alba]MDM7855666.1 hypothetical protein [Cellulomonas alba]
MAPPQLLTRRRCSVCGAAPTAWLAHLDADRSWFGVPGDRRSWGTRVDLCDECRALVEAGDVEAVVARLAARDGDDGDRTPAAAALCAAFVSAVAVADWLPPGVVAAVPDGFVELGELTGWLDLANAWPAEHVRRVPETREDHLRYADSDEVVLVRSPWPGVDVGDVVSYLISWADQHEAFVSGDVTPERRERERAIVRDFFVAFDAAFREEWDRHLRDWM